MKEEFNGTRLTLEIDGRKVTWESPYGDHTTSDLVEAFFGLCVTHTFMPLSVLDAFNNFYEGQKTVYPELNENDTIYSEVNDEN